MNVLDTPTSPPRTAPPLDREWADDRELDVFSGVMFVWRYRLLIAGATLVAASLGFLATRMMPQQFTAIATVFVNIPRTQNPLAPDALSIEALDRLANSEIMQTQVSAALRQRNMTGEGRQVFALQTVLYKSTDPQKPYLPLLGLSAVASTPELARDVANVWAAVMTAETQKLAAATRASAVDFIVSEYPKAAERLNDQERNLEALQRTHGEALQAARNAAAVSLKEEQLWSREQFIVSLEEQRNRLTLDLKQVEATVAALEAEIKQVPALLTVTRALGDDTLLGAAATSGQVPAALAATRLQSEQVNPVHTELTRRLADARVRRSELVARKPAIDAQIEASRRDAVSIRASLGGSQVTIANLERLQALEAAAMEREVERVRANFAKLEEQIGDAQIVKADTESTLTLGSPAELPESPSGPEVARTVGIAGTAGLALALMAAWIADRTRRPSPTP
jgi:uncharacterized protein involved in exopolysaccharide biosynthesis